ncbi:helix-turn-helix domain-containing protein [Rubritalea sp.]|uniref:helix-turn-helix domain-containing protein n=1 Tax=Rubritalea sp. TaxID=2109375 RepID=UPI003EF3CD8C
MREDFRGFRLRAGLSQAQLAEMAGIRQATISAIENGQTQPHFSTIQALAKALSCSSEELQSAIRPVFSSDDAIGQFTGDWPFLADLDPDLRKYKKFEKYRFITVNVIRNRKDPRPESHKIDLTTLHVDDEKLNIKDCWRDRRKWVLDRATVHTNLTELINKANKENSLSLATFKPTKIIKFVAEEEENRDWDSDKIAKITEESKQQQLFDEFQPETLTSLVDKRPYKFSCVFEDDSGRESKMMIEDWEIGALYRNALKTSESEAEAISKVREKYFDEFGKKDLHLFLGTTREWHGRGKNPFVIIGLFYPDYQNAPELDLFD